MVLPDLDVDGVRDLVMLAIGELQPNLCFLLASGWTGTPVKYNITGVGNLVPRFTASPLGPSTSYLALEIYKLLP